MWQCSPASPNSLKVGDPVEIVGLKDTQQSVATGIEMFRKLLDQGQAGDNVGILLRGIDKEKIERGQVIAAPKSCTPHKKFKGEVYILTKDEGGRHTPFFKGYKPQFYFRTTDVTGSVKLKPGVEMIMPGDHAEMTVELISPIAMEKELRFAIREGPPNPSPRRPSAGLMSGFLPDTPLSVSLTAEEYRSLRFQLGTLKEPDTRLSG